MILSAITVSGQAIVTDTIPKGQMYIPTFFRLGADLLGGIHTAINDSRDAWEIQGEVDVYRYFLVGELGGETNYFVDKNYEYRSNGIYGRFGVDINMIPREAWGSVLFFGLRYGRSNFEEQLYGAVFDPIWGYTIIDDSNKLIQARWYEIVTGMKAKVWKNLYLGYILRLKVSLKIMNPYAIEVDPFRIPGYGLADQNSFYGINYYVAWKFSFRQKYTMPRQP